MKWVKWFARGESADDALVALARQAGWAPAPASGQSMLPPSHRRADVHDLEGRRPPQCAGRAFAAPLGSRGIVATVSHLQVITSDEQQDDCNMVLWTVPAGTVPRFEVELGLAAWGHHRLGDRFQPAGWAKGRVGDRGLLRLSRATAPEVAERLAGATEWADMERRATAPALRGCAAEGLGNQLAVFTANLSRAGQAQWTELLAVAATLDAMVGRVA